nr:RNA-directed DNA polymerase, eukaryota [Tanacetum cinerariifolium]
MSWFLRCSWCGGPFNDVEFIRVSIIGAESKFVHDPNPFPYDNTPNFYDQPPHHHVKTYSCELRGNDSHYGYDCLPWFLLVDELESSYNQNIGLPNDIYSLIDSNKTAKDLWDALARHMLGSEYGEQDRKAAVLYEYETFKATEGELLLDTYIRYLQYAIIMRQNKNLMDINIDALYNILKKNQGDVNDAMGSKKKNVVVTFDPFALIAEKTNVSRSKEKVVVSSDSKGSEADDFSELKKITALLAKAFNRRKFYSKPTNNNLRTSSSSDSANKKQEFLKTDNKRVEKER